MKRKEIVKKVVSAIAFYILGVFSAMIISNWDFASINQEIGDVSDSIEGTFGIIQVDNLEMERGFVYTGGIRNNCRYGQGRMMTPKGTIYEGEWFGNQLIEGIMIAGKSEYEGQFKNLSPHGYGTMKYKDGAFYRGMWQTGVKSGIGLFVDSIGNRSFGFWDKGVIDKKTMNTNVGKKVFGIDVSHHNQIKDWGNMALYARRDGLVYSGIPQKDFCFQPVDFIFFKATEGATHRDRNYLSNMINAKKYHKKRGSYHFMHLTSSKIEEQVDNFLDYIVLEKGDLPPVLDIEVIKEAEEIGVKETQQRVLRWLRAVEDKLGMRPIIYTSANMKRDYFSSLEFGIYDFWVAHYKKTVPDFDDYEIWQFTDKGKLYGNDCLVDINHVCHSRNELFMKLK